MDVTHMLQQWHGGQTQAFDALVDTVYEDLYGRAHRLIRREHNPQTLQTGVLVNEAYLRLIELKHIDWQNRQHFFAVAAKVMRRILIDHARSKNAIKRGGDVIHVSYDESSEQHVGVNDTPVVGQGANAAYGSGASIASSSENENSVDLVALDNALNQLQQHNETLAQIVELRFFTGLKMEEIGEQLSMSHSTVKRKWKLAQAWLYREMQDS